MGKKKEVTIGLQKSPEARPNQKKRISSKLRKRGKQYLHARSSTTTKKLYSISEAFKLLKQIAYEHFDAAVEVHINTVEPSLKGEVNLPHGTGRQIRIAVFDSKVEDKINQKILDFDILLATPKDMPKLVKYARILGPKGLMPSPKKGTLTEKIKETIEKFSRGAVQYQTEPKFPILHQVIGRKSFTEKQLLDNIEVFITAINKKNVKSLYIKTSMSPSLLIDLNSL